MNGGPTSTLDTESGASALAAEIDGGEKDEKDDEDELPDSNEKSTANTRPPEAADGILPVTEHTGYHLGLQMARRRLGHEGVSVTWHLETGRMNPRTRASPRSST
jgi:hypothetical protein